MRSLWLGVLMTTLAYGQVPEPRLVEGKTLATIPGPLANRERLPDLAPRFGSPDMDLQIRAMARRGGRVPAVQVPEGTVAISHKVTPQAGWQAYRVEVAPGEKIHARLRGDHEAWFVVRCVNGMGQLEQGMLQNLIKRGNPEATYTNPRKGTSVVYFVVDTSEVLGAYENYTLTFTRINQS